jgi:transcriptional regulator with XRE-family HTH domain
MDIGKRIKDARLAKGLTQEELGNIVGLQKSAIAKYENGRVVNIKRSTLQKLAQALGLRGSDLIMESDQPETKKEQPTEYDGLSEKKKALMQFAMSVPDDKAEMILQVMKTILKNG